MNRATVKKHISHTLMCFLIVGCHTQQTTTGFIVDDNLDLGSVSVGDTVNFTVGIKNPTDEAVKIVDIRGTCGCVKVKSYPSTLKALQNGTINATYYSLLERKSAGVVTKALVLRLDKEPFIHSANLKVTVR